MRQLHQGTDATSEQLSPSVSSQSKSYRNAYAKAHPALQTIAVPFLCHSHFHRQELEEESWCTELELGREGFRYGIKPNSGMKGDKKLFRGHQKTTGRVS